MMSEADGFERLHQIVAKITVIQNNSGSLQSLLKRGRPKKQLNQTLMRSHRLFEAIALYNHKKEM